MARGWGSSDVAVVNALLCDNTFPLRGEFLGAFSCELRHDPLGRMIRHKLFIENEMRGSAECPILRFAHHHGEECAALLLPLA